MGSLLHDAPTTYDLRVGAIVVATGFRPYEPHPGEFGYGEFPGVITLPQLERLLAPDGPTGGRLEWGDRPIRSVAFIHCVGSRQIDGRARAAGRWSGQRLLLARVLHRHACKPPTPSARAFRRSTSTTSTKTFAPTGAATRPITARAADNQCCSCAMPAESRPSGRARLKAACWSRSKTGSREGEEMDVQADLVVLAVGMDAEPRARPD